MGADQSANGLPARFEMTHQLPQFTIKPCQCRHTIADLVHRPTHRLHCRIDLRDFIG